MEESSGNQEPTTTATPRASALTTMRPQGSINRAPSYENQEIFMLPRQKSRSKERRESRLFLVDGQLCWTDEHNNAAFGSKRHSSAGLMFGSSMDLSGIGQSIDSSGGAGSGSEEAISYRIKWCRENIMQLKRQTWPMEKKLQVLKASKLFIKQHQGELKQSKQAKDVLASTSAIFERYWRHFKREFANFLVIITPWEMRIKKIESHFGSVVASYFTFLRWIFWLNLANSLVMVAFVMVPELIENVPDLTGMRKGQLGMQQPMGSDGKPVAPPEFNPTLGEMWEFEGFLKSSPIFYGYYSNVEISRSGFWRNPLAFLMSAMITYLFCFFCISRKLSQNTKLSRIGSKDDEYTFCWTVFVGWDFMIGNSETAYNKTSSLVMNLKEGILEEKEQTKDRDWRLIIRRVLANVLTIMLIVASAYVVTLVVQRSENLPDDASLLQKNELQLVMSGIQFMFPPLFDFIGIIEKYHPRKALSWQLGRILFLDFLNFYTLMFSLFGTVDQLGNQLNEISGNITLFRKNSTYFRNLFTTTTTTTTTTLAPIEVLSSTINSLITNNTNNNNESTTIASLVSSLSSTTPITASNATTLLTSILLATSSTMMPSSNNESTTTINSLSNQTTTTTTVDSLIGSTPFFDTLSSTITSTLSFAETTTTSLPITTLAPTTISTVSTTKGPDLDEDYPDLGEVMKEVGRSSPKRRRKREAQANNDGEDKKSRRRSRLKGRRKRKQIESSLNDAEIIKLSEREREDSGVSDELVTNKRTTTPTTIKPRTRTFAGAYIPPMKDPYLKGPKAIVIQWPARTNQQEGAGMEDEEEEEDEEEPLEGRLELEKSSGKKTTSTTTTTTRRPIIKQGLARPIGGSKLAPPSSSTTTTTTNNNRGSRVQLTTTKLPANNLDDDANEDMIDEGGSNTAAANSMSSEFFFEPTTPQPLNNEANGSGSGGGLPDYSILGSPASESSSSSSSLNPNLESSSSSGIDNTIPQTTTTSDSIQGKSGLAAGQSTTNSNSESTTQLVSSCTNFDSSLNEEQLYSNETGGGVFKLKSKPPIGFNASEVSYTDCLEIPEFKHQEILGLNDTLKDKLKSLCWETMFGQEMVKIVVMDLVMTVISAVSFEFMRACFVRYCNRFFFWDLERGFPGYQDFKIAENVLHLVNNQSTVWMGMFFAPGLPAINTVKLAVLMYVRSWAVLTCNIPHETVFKVSKSNNFYYWILLINLLICILPVAYAVTWIRPSWHCGPFAGECRMYIVVTKLVKSMLPPEANSVFKYMTSPGAVIPILIALILIIYYLASTVSSSKEANKELKAQLKKDKEQEAAVPEITNTTVVDATPAVAATTAAASTTNNNLNNINSGSLDVNKPPVAAGNQVAGNNTLVAPNPNTLAPTTNLSTATAQQTSEKRPKSLLMPPSIA